MKLTIEETKQRLHELAENNLRKTVTPEDG